MAARQWINEHGQTIPSGYINKEVKLMDRKANSLYKGALKLNEQLKKFKQLISDACWEVFIETMKARDIDVKDKEKSNFTFYDFSKKIKIEMKDNENSKYDDLYAKSASEKLTRFLAVNIASKNEFIKEIVLEALKQTNGKIDPRKIATLFKYEDKIKHPLYQSALADLREGHSRVKTKFYYTLSVRNNEGEYEPVLLNFSAIKL